MIGCNVLSGVGGGGMWDKGAHGMNTPEHYSVGRVHRPLTEEEAREEGLRVKPKNDELKSKNLE